MNDRFTRVCLVTVIVLLSVIAFRPYVHPDEAHAAAQKWQYKTAIAESSDVAVDEVLNKYSNDGWELVASTINPQYGPFGVVLLIFRK